MHVGARGLDPRLAERRDDADLIEHDLSAEEIAKQGHDPATVNRVWRLLEAAEYKRRQAPPGVKITSRLISNKERRYPIVNGFRG